ncbi:hypothetical protein BD779DRAFT_1538459 [Infundibulicybe gibba]|nr:hypothetical protein BD779DRAFT_1538459 [Infundibulicybe gibba]
MGKRRRPAIDILPEDDSNPLPRPPIIQEHTNLRADHHGVKVAQMFHAVSAPAEEPSSSQFSINAAIEPITWNTEIPEALDDEDGPTDHDGAKVKRKRTAGDDPLRLWLPEIDGYLRELLRLEGRGSMAHQKACAHCGVSDAPPAYRCDDCLDIRLSCKVCIVHCHAGLPFHRIKEWRGGYFIVVHLKDLGLRIQLGHPIGQPCTNPKCSFNNEFVVVDTNGIHQISLDFCNCQTSEPSYVQLLRSRLFPATASDPKTAATFHTLEYFQLLSFMSKVSAFEFYNMMARRTDNTGTSPPPDRYEAFLRMVHEWRHLKMLKRFGRGHDPSGVSGTHEGELAVLCPACPHPSKNLPVDWEAVQKKRSAVWRYALFLGIDANFKLKRLNVSSETRDPGLNHGYAYFVGEPRFKGFLQDRGSFSCNNHDAVKSANIRGGKGIAASGVGTIECIRHDMKWPVSVGDLQKGEQYINMDYFFSSSVKHHSPELLVVSYDIACQWSQHLWQCLSAYPQDRQISQKFENITYLIPKFHLPAHRLLCQATFSFNYTPGVGRTDGEAPERGWANSNGTTSSTKEMGPGSRRDTLDDHFGDYNWRKVSSLGTSILRKSIEAVAACKEHIAAFEAFSAALPAENVALWARAVREWESDRTRPNPFQSTPRTVSESRVRLELAEEEEADQRKHNTAVVHNDIPPSVLIAQGLELEDMQQRMKEDIHSLSSGSTDLQRSKVVERSNRLRRRIEAWMEVQVLYMPMVSRLRAAMDCQGGEDPVEVYDIDLMLPSAVSGRIKVERRLMRFEWRLRYAQAHDNLHQMCRHLLLRTHMFRFKQRYEHGQQQHTRSLGAIKSLQAKIDADATRYRKNHAALSQLATTLHPVGWESSLSPLHDSDIRALNSAEREGTTEGRRTMSWIWRAEGAGEGDQAMQEGLQIEWCKARARAHRWQEECILLQEEMRRIKAFLGWEIQTWSDRADATRGADVGAATREGLQAYALRQASIREAMRAHWVTIWAELDALFSGLRYTCADANKIQVDHTTVDLNAAAQ